MTILQTAYQIASAWWLMQGRGMLDDPEALQDLTNAIADALKAERERAAAIAFKLQMEQFGGGTAIGNAIQDQE